MELNNTDVKSIALFFYYSLLDEELAKAATARTVRACQKTLGKLEPDQKDLNSLVVQNTFQVWEKSPERSKLLAFSGAGFAHPRDVELGPWKQFLKSADEDEILAVIWSKILKFSDLNIAEGLDVTEGTIRYRVGRGLRKLGQFRHAGRLSE